MVPNRIGTLSLIIWFIIALSFTVIEESVHPVNLPYDFLAVFIHVLDSDELITHGTQHLVCPWHILRAEEFQPLPSQ